MTRTPFDRLAKSALENYGYKVVLAANGKEGVDLFQELVGQIDAVLLDMTMPVMSGEEALAGLKNIRSDVPVVLSSGYEVKLTRRAVSQARGWPASCKNPMQPRAWRRK